MESTERPAASKDHIQRREWVHVLREALLRIPGAYQAASLLTAVRFVVAGDSMGPGLASNQHLLVSRLAYRSQLPARRDVVVIHDPEQPGVHCIKRIIGLPGEHIHMDMGQVFIDGRPLEEPYIDEKEPWGTPVPNQWLLECDQYFVLGDHRQDSRDSRSFGPVRRCDILGKAWVRYWSPAMWKRL